MIIEQPQQQLTQWYQTVAGKQLLLEENTILIKGLKGLFGYHLIVLGGVDYAQGLSTSAITHKVVMNDCILGDSPQDLLGNRYNLPLQKDSIDVMVLPHLLEFSQHPHNILREVERVITPDGYLLILGFNPVSCYGLCRTIFGFRQQMPWQGHYYHPVRLRDWLQLLGFKIVKLDYCGFIPPIPHEGTQQHLAFMEKAADSFIAPFGSVYMIVAQNQTVTPNVIKKPWKSKRTVIENGVVEPTSRVTNRHDG